MRGTTVFGSSAYWSALLLFVPVLGCSKTASPRVLEIPEIGMSVEVGGMWRLADPAASENPFGFVEPRIEEAGPHRVRIAKQPKGGTEIVWVTGTFPVPNVSILGYPERNGSPSTLDECASLELSQPFDSVSWQLSPSALTVPGVESRATLADHETRAGADLRSEILVVVKNGRCYSFKGTTAQSLWKGQHALIEGFLSSLRPDP